MRLRIRTGEEVAGKRLDQFLKERLPDISRSRIQKAVRDGSCSLGGQIICAPDYRVLPGQELEFILQDKPAALQAEKGELKILWHDEYLAVCDKSPDLTVHPCPSCPENTLAQRLLSRFPQLAEMGGERPGIVHRLDKDTSGLLLVALTEEARLRLADDFCQRKINKEYLALVQGTPPEKGECRQPIGRDPDARIKMAIVPENRGGKPAHSEWRRLWHAPDGAFSLVAVKIFTGRTHQIRVHMAGIGHPVLGDRLYAPAAARDIAPRQMLHAARLELSHPISHERLRFSAPLPEDFKACLLDNARQMQKIVVTGNPGCGKSSFSKALARRGLPVIDADAIVKDLYSRPGHVADWLKMRGYLEALQDDGSVSKSGLMAIFEKEPGIRKEFEDFIHALVWDKIIKFWDDNKSSMAAIAEIPLYFERGWQKIGEKPVTVGIHCDQAIRFERLATDRGWSQEKIHAIESWQMPEARKMELCDLVYDNMGATTALETHADEFIEYLRERQREREDDVLMEIKRLITDCPTLPS